MAYKIMIQGTMSNAGKSVLTAALLRVLKQEGFRCAPFKSQNMALNSYITSDGLEIGRAQAMQAEAAGIKPAVEMNPILLKPTGDMASQVIVMGKPVANMKAADYFHVKKTYIPIILDAFHKLEEEYDVIVIEGAGSPAEINLKENDIVNMGLANMVDSPVLLVGDIDRGGVFAQLYGTWGLLEPDERDRIKGMLVNKFRGDREILEPGFELFAKYCPIPVLGVMPYMKLDLDEEDSLAERLDSNASSSVTDIVVVRLPHISNFTDFAPLERADGVSLRYVASRKDFGKPDMVILPGTKNTLGDLSWLSESGLKDLVVAHAKSGGYVLGICGGYQMLGETIADPHGAETGGSAEGLKLLHVDTLFSSNKNMRQTAGVVFTESCSGKLSGIPVKGYEIHMGESVRHGGRAFLQLEGDREEGCVQDNVAGTYLHGLFDSDEFLKAFLDMLFTAKGMDRRGFPEAEPFINHKENEYDRLADAFRANCDLDAIWSIIGLDGLKELS